MSGDARAEDTQVVDQLEEVWTRISEFGASLTDEQWKLPTALPGWSVQDNLTHYQDLMQGLRDAIMGQRLTAHIAQITSTYAAGDIDPR